MKLMTKAIEATLPPLYTHEDTPADRVPVAIKFFNPMGAATWYITEGQRDGDTFVFFGLCDLGMGYPELGYVTLAELESVRLPAGLGIERDLYLRDGFTLADAQAAVAA